jgi:hypothetical protein
VSEYLDAVDRIRVRRYARGVAALDPGSPLRRVAELHGPKGFPAAEDVSVWLECRGCDPGPQAVNGADWPCRTVDLLFPRLALAKP